jgi:hypothetical protein
VPLTLGSTAGLTRDCRLLRGVRKGVGYRPGARFGLNTGIVGSWGSDRGRNRRALPATKSCVADPRPDVGRRLR